MQAMRCTHTSCHAEGRGFESLHPLLRLQTRVFAGSSGQLRVPRLGSPGDVSPVPAAEGRPCHGAPNCVRFLVVRRTNTDTRTVPYKILVPKLCRETSTQTNLVGLRGRATSARRSPSPQDPARCRSVPRFAPEHVARCRATPPARHFRGISRRSNTGGCAPVHI